MKLIDYPIYRFVIYPLGFLLIFAATIFIFVKANPIPKLEINQVMKECIEANGQFQIRDWSLKYDGSEYKATCEIPEHYLWKYEI